MSPVVLIFVILPPKPAPSNIKNLDSPCNFHVYFRSVRKC